MRSNSSHELSSWKRLYGSHSFTSSDPTASITRWINSTLDQADAEVSDSTLDACLSEIALILEESSKQDYGTHDNASNQSNRKANGKVTNSLSTENYNYNRHCSDNQRESKIVPRLKSPLLVSKLWKQWRYQSHVRRGTEVAFKQKVDSIIRKYCLIHSLRAWQRWTRKCTLKIQTFDLQYFIIRKKRVIKRWQSYRVFVNEQIKVSFYD